MPPRVMNWPGVVGCDVNFALMENEPFDGIDFGSRRPAFETLRQASLPQPTTHRALPGAPVGTGQDQLFDRVQAIAESTGFRMQRRALPPGVSVLVIDLMPPERVFEVVPRKARRDS